MKKLNLSWLRLLSFLTIMGLTVNLFGQAEPLWKTKFKKNVDWLKVAPTGHLIVGTGKGLFGVDPDSGKVLWKNKELRGLLEQPREVMKGWFQKFLPYRQIAVVKEFSGAHKFMKHGGMPYYLKLINVVTGEDLWSSKSLNLKEDYGYFYLPEVGGMLIYAKNKNKKKTMLLVDVTTGKVIWENQEFFKDREPTMFKVIGSKRGETGPYEGETIVGNPQPLFDTDTTMITSMNLQSVRKFNAMTGELVWETNVDSPVSASQMQLTRKGLVVMNAHERYIALVDLTSGEVLWKDFMAGTNFVINDEEIILFASGKLYAISLADGNIATLTEDLQFENGERPVSLALREDGYFLRSRNNIMLLSFFGEKVFETYFEGPKFSAKEGLLGGLVRELTRAMVAKGWEVDVEDLQQNYPEWMHGASMDNAQFMQYMKEKRFKATKHQKNYTYILAQIEAKGKKKAGLVKVNNTNGETEDQIILGTKKPIYGIDEIKGRLFFRASKKEVVCFEF